MDQQIEGAASGSLTRPIGAESCTVAGFYALNVLPNAQVADNYDRVRAFRTPERHSVAVSRNCTDETHMVIFDSTVVLPHSPRRRARIYLHTRFQ